MLRYARHKAYYRALRPTMTFFRKRRMRRLAHLLESCPRDPDILDLGGQPQIWDHVGGRLRITILNLPGEAASDWKSRHDIKYIEGDACDLSDFGDRSFDVVFSNSVIEHVGDRRRRDAFSREASRVGNALWIQTPSKHFPVDPHTGMPFWWYYPDPLRDRILANWRAKLPAWTRMVEGTTYVTYEELRENFPDCAISTERFLALPKSYIVTRKYAA